MWRAWTSSAARSGLHVTDRPHRAAILAEHAAGSNYTKLALKYGVSEPAMRQFIKKHRKDVR